MYILTGISQIYVLWHFSLKFEVYLFGFLLFFFSFLLLIKSFFYLFSDSIFYFFCLEVTAVCKLLASFKDKIQQQSNI